MPACGELMVQNLLRFGGHKGPQLQVRRRHQRGDALDQLQRAEHQVGLSATALRFGAVVDQLGSPLAQPIQRKRRARSSAAAAPGRRGPAPGGRRRRPPRSRSA